MSDVNRVTVNIKVQGKCLWLTLEGRLCISCIGDFTSTFWKFLDEHKTKYDAVVVDMTDVNSIDSTGLATLIHIHQKVAQLHAFGLDETLTTMIDRVGLDRIFHIHATEKDALKALKK